MLMDTIWKVTAAVIDIDGGAPEVRFSKVCLKRHSGEMRLVRMEEDKDRAAALSRPSVIVVTGGGVSSKPVVDGDPSVARIMKSGELYVTVHAGDRTSPTVDFIRKDSVSGVVPELERACALVIGIMVSRNAGDIGAMVEQSCSHRLGFRRLPSDVPLLAALCGQLYRSLRLPLLVAYLLVLAVNWILFSGISGRLQQRRSEHDAMVRDREAAAESDSRQKGLERMFSDLPDLAARSAAGRVAGAVPAGTRLTGLSISSGDEDGTSPDRGARISVSGETLDPEEIVEMSRRLAGTAGFRQADISSIETDGRYRDRLKFNIDIRR